MNKILKKHTDKILFFVGFLIFGIMIAISKIYNIEIYGTIYGLMTFIIVLTFIVISSLIYCNKIKEKHEVLSNIIRLFVILLIAGFFIASIIWLICELTI